MVPFWRVENIERVTPTPPPPPPITIKKQKQKQKQKTKQNKSKQKTKMNSVHSRFPPPIHPQVPGSESWCCVTPSASQVVISLSVYCGMSSSRSRFIACATTTVAWAARLMADTDRTCILCCVRETGAPVWYWIVRFAVRFCGITWGQLKQDV